MTEAVNGVPVNKKFSAEKIKCKEKSELISQRVKPDRAACRESISMTSDIGHAHSCAFIAFHLTSLSLLAWCKLNELIEVRFKLKIDIEDKREAEDIDSEQMALNKDCSNITYKVDPLRVPRNANSYNGWLENCKELKLLTEAELQQSHAVRESLFVSREKTKNLLFAQQEKTEHTIRRRIFETQRQRNELQWQKMKVGGVVNKNAFGMEFCHSLAPKPFYQSRLLCSLDSFALSPRRQSDARRVRKSRARDKRFARHIKQQGQCAQARRDAIGKSD